MRYLIFILLLIIAGEVNSQNCSNNQTGLIPINDLGTGYWNGFQGGLYPAGSNTRPTAHTLGGLTLSNQISPLDTSGNPSVNGKVLFISIGMSNGNQEFLRFKIFTDSLYNKNPKLVLINCAIGGKDIDSMTGYNKPYWNYVRDTLRKYGYTPKQVQIVWLKQAERLPDDGIAHIDTLKNKFRMLMQIMKNKFINLKLCYLPGRIYGGYTMPGLGNPEPYAYYTGWTTKFLIEDQINGDTGLTYSGTNPRSPWLSWGVYLWADGINMRSDGLNWICPDDFEPDGVHPSSIGETKVANLLVNFFKTDTTTKRWYLNLVSDITLLNKNIPSSYSLEQNYPNPFNSSTNIKFQIINYDRVVLKVFDLLGKEVKTLVNEELQPGAYEVKFDAGDLSSGIYLYTLNTNKLRQTKKLIMIK